MTTLDPIGQDLRSAIGKYERLTNAQQRKLVAAYNDWARATAQLILTVVQHGGSVSQQQTILTARLPILETTIRQIANAGTRAGVMAGVPRTLRDLPSVKGTTLALLTNNTKLIHEGLIPGIQVSLNEQLLQGAAESKATLLESFGSLSHRPASYAGGAWLAIFEAQKMAGWEQEKQTGEQQRVRWNLSPDAVHCEPGEPGYYGCTELEGEYDTWSDLPTVPAGRTRCRGNCRCFLEAEVNGEWQRGLV